MRRNSQFSYIIRIIAGIYLLYIAIPMLLKEGGHKADAPAFAMIGFSLLFIVAALYFIISSIRGIFKDRQAMAGGQTEEKEEGALEETKQKTDGIAEESEHDKEA